MTPSSAKYRDPVYGVHIHLTVEKVANMSSLPEIIDVIRTEAQAEEENVPGAHIRLLEATERLRQKVETPGDALVRFRFQVSL